MRRPLSSVLSLALVLGSPGGDAARAFAGAVSRPSPAAARTRVPVSAAAAARRPSALARSAVPVRAPAPDAVRPRGVLPDAAAPVREALAQENPARLEAGLARAYDLSAEPSRISVAGREGAGAPVLAFPRPAPRAAELEPPVWMARRIARLERGWRVSLGVAAAAAAAGLIAAAVVAPLTTAAIAAVAARPFLKLLAPASPKVPARYEFLDFDFPKGQIERARAVYGAVVERLGLPPERAPYLGQQPFAFDNGGAAGIGLGPASVVAVGKSFMDLPPSRMAAFFGHELGHLRFEDGRLAPRLRDAAGDWARAALPYQAALAASVLLTASVGLALGPAWLAGTALAGALSLPALGAARLYGRAAMRWRELRADHFGARLTDPGWSVDFLSSLKIREAPGLADRLDRTHPYREERLRRLRDLREGSADGGKAGGASGIRTRE